MLLLRSDYDEAARYAAYAIELLEREAFSRTTTIRNVLQLAARRLSPGDHYVEDAAAEITMLRDIAYKVTVAAARTEILKAVPIVSDQTTRSYRHQPTRNELQGRI